MPLMLVLQAHCMFSVMAICVLSTIHIYRVGSVHGATLMVCVLR